MVLKYIDCCGCVFEGVGRKLYNYGWGAGVMGVVWQDMRLEMGGGD